MNNPFYDDRRNILSLEEVCFIVSYLLHSTSVYIVIIFQTLQPPKAPPNQARLIVTPESTLEFGKVLGSGAFGTVHEVCECVCVCIYMCV